jgi:hypothetical protein
MIACSSSDSGAPAGAGDAGPDVGTNPSDDAGDGSSLPPDGGSTSPLLDPKGGTRLEAHWFATADGAVQFDTFFDKSLGVSCSFQVAADGSLRCLPLASEVAAAASYFTNATCTSELLTGYCLGSPTYGAHYDRGKCPGDVPLKTHVLPVGAGVTPGQLYLDAPTCTAALTPQGAAFYPVVGAERPPTTFVGGTLTVMPTVGGVAPVRLDADDGSSFLYGFRDMVRDIPCQVDFMSDARLHCVGETGLKRAPGLFADAACTVVGFAMPDATCASPALGSQLVSANCEDETHLYTLTRLPAGTDAHTTVPGTCQPLGRPTIGVFSAVEIPPAATPSVGSSDLPSTAGLQEPVYETGGVRVRQAYLFDPARSERCSFAVANDGATRCLPQTDTRADVYLDAGCTQRLAYRTVQGCSAPPTSAVGEVQTAVCPTGRAAVFSVGAAHSVSTIYRFLAGVGCIPDMATASYEYFDVGAELAPTTFVKGTALVR